MLNKGIIFHESNKDGKLQSRFFNNQNKELLGYASTFWVNFIEIKIGTIIQNNYKDSKFPNVIDFKVVGISINSNGGKDIFLELLE
jgi:hypothetical protein